jgi:hypothetical protein
VNEEETSYDLGDGHSWQKRLMDGTGEWVGIMERHAPGHGPSFIAFKNYIWSGWDKSGDEATLTLSPSLLCMRCGDHGFIRNGKWVKA